MRLQKQAAAFNNLAKTLTLFGSKQLHKGQLKILSVGSTRFRRRFRKALVESQARFNEVLEKVPEGFGGEPGQVQRGSREGSGGLWWRAGPGSTRFWRRFRRALVESRARINEVPEKVLEKVPEGLGAPGSTRLQVGSGAIRAVCRCSFSVKFQQISDEKDCEAYLLLLLEIPPKFFLGDL